MAIKIGFVILSYDHPDRLLRLVRRLQTMFEEPDIVCHHDFTKCGLDLTSFPVGVRFVRPAQRTAWGGVSIVLAELLALQTLYAVADPDWFVMLSAADYPAKSAKAIVAELERSPYDAYLDHRKVVYRAAGSHAVVPLSGYDRPEWMRAAYNRYVAIRITWRSLRRRRPRLILIRHPMIVRPLTWFSSTLPCFAGDHWLTGTRRIAKLLLGQHKVIHDVLQRFSRRPIADEAVYQTVLCNESALNICGDNKRYTAWSWGEAHPKNLHANDIPQIVGSGAHFARKFAPDDPALDSLDAITET